VTWNAVVAALDDGDTFRSSVSLYLHPLAGRPIVWHALLALAGAESKPASVRVLHRATSPMQLPESFPVPVRAEPVEAGQELLSLRAAVTPAGITMLMDGAAPLVAPSTVDRMLRAAERGMVALRATGEDIACAAVAGEGPALASSDDPRRPHGAVSVAATAPEEVIRITDRHAMAEAALAIHDRLIRRHEAAGVSFVLPATTWVDADVTIGADTVIYPGAVLEGQTKIGSECVIGPYTRLVDATLGRGVELKGWNYVARTAVRNHAVLEPYVRRGFD
jgi:bifunctional N-acetylglucosamine-1-phosphate-uridyltransferase/glucosamine-1-phosphate-acetyltransferase GlmU-like protein